MLVDENSFKDTKDRCRECYSELIFDNDTGEQVCSVCGIVNGNVEITTVSASPSSPPPMELGSVLGNTTSSTTVQDLKGFSAIVERTSGGDQKRGPQNYELSRLKRLNNLVMANDSKTRNFRRALREIRRLTNSLGLGNSIVDTAFQIYRKGLSNGRTRGRSISGMAGAAVYLACRDLGVPRSAEEIENVAENLNHKSIRRYSKILLREANIVVDTPDPSSSVSRIAKQAGLSGLTERKAIQILDQVKDKGVLAGKRPVSIAAAALYVASVQTGEHITQLRIAFAAEITTITLRKRSAEIMQLLEEIGQPTSVLASALAGA